MRVEIDGGVGIYFDIAGEGLVPDGDTMRERPTVLMLHGGPGADHSSLKPYFSQLSDRAQVVYIDHRGQGRSDRRPREEWTLDTWADDVVRFCDAVGIHDPIVIGLSFGGAVAQHYGSRHPDHPSGLVLISTTPRDCDDASVDVFRRLGGAEAADAARAFYTNFTEATRDRFFEVCGPLYTQSAGNIFDPGATIWNHEVAEHFFEGEGRALDLRAELSRVVAPCLILAGADDPATPAVGATEIRDSLTSASVDLRVFDKCGHGVHRDCPDETMAVIKDFVDDVSRATSTSLT